jgi:hypothetical protein
MQARSKSFPKFRFAAALSMLPLFALVALAQDQAAPAADPPGRVARIAVMQGNVSVEPAGVDSFSQAELNYPLTAGDRVYVDLQGLAELQTSDLTVRMGNGADVTIASLTDQIAQIGLAQGSIRISTHDLTTPDGGAGTVEIDTPNGSIMVQLPGDIRVDSYPQSDTTVVTVTSGQVAITGPNFDRVLGPNQALQLTGLNPVTAQAVGMLPPDNLDRFDQDRESLAQGAANADANYVSPDMTGASDLAQYGDWSPDPEYGDVWYPRAVAVGWVPYQNGHWAWVAPWGWTWVGFEPWGFAPYHYGRWGNFGGRWGWVPGPPPIVFGRPVPPIYSPALVAFVGGPGVSLALGFGGGSGGGVTAWFPLGPREPYVPWYHASTLYVNRVNVTNIYSRNTTEVRTGYSNRRSPVYNVDVANTTFANRNVATTAVTQKDFAAGHSIARSQRIPLDANARAQIGSAPVLPHPLVTPTAAMAAPQTPARAVPPTLARPVLAGRDGSARPESTTFTTNGQPVTEQRQPMTRPAVPAPSLPEQRDRQPVAQPMTEPEHNQPRALINQTPPQPVQPKFEQQRQEIERNDPGRPLGPQQVENMRGGHPAGAASQPEPQHPAPRSAPPPPPPARSSGKPK